MPATTEWQPRTVERVDTKYRKIVTPIPVPDSIPILEKLKRFEPEAMGGQPPVVWDRPEGISVFDRWGNQWLDWSSGVLITNAGHGRQEIVTATSLDEEWRDAIAHLLVRGIVVRRGAKRRTLVDRAKQLLPDLHVNGEFRGADAWGANARRV